jgi:tetratricopeptide (TPR) repeat protein
VSELTPGPLAAREATLPELIRQAEGLVSRRRIELARRLLRDALQRFPDNADLLYLAACADWMEDDNAAAISTVNRVLVLAPAHYGARRLRADLLREAKDYVGAEAALIELLREHPEDADCYSRYALVMLDTVHLDKARALAQEGLRHEPDHPGCLFALTLTDLVSGRPAASASLATLMREHPEHVHTASALIVALNARRDYRGALRVAQELLRSRPDSAHHLQLVRELKVLTHWSLLPLYPVLRWGRRGQIGVWIIGVLCLQLLGGRAPPWITKSALIVWLGYIAYSWIWPPILRKII